MYLPIPVCYLYLVDVVSVSLSSARALSKRTVQKKRYRTAFLESSDGSHFMVVIGMQVGPHSSVMEHQNGEREREENSTKTKGGEHKYRAVIYH